MRNRAGVWILLVLAPFCAEYLTGSISVRELVALPFLVPLYGAAAVLIRESARRQGRGWPSMLLLGAAFGVLQAGIVDASLFNTGYAGLDLSGAMIPGLDLGAVYGLAFVMNHVMLSIGAPIALAEALAPGGPATAGRPWLGRAGLVVTGLAYAGGSLLIGWDNWQQERFYPSPLQLTVAAVTVAGLVTAAFVLPRRAPDPGPTANGPRTGRAAPPASRAARVTALTTGLYFFVPANGAGLALGVTLITGTLVLVHRWSRSPGWTERHVIAVAAGALLTGAWGAWFVGDFTGRTDTVTRTGNVALALVTFGIVGFALRTARSMSEPDIC